MVDFKQLNKCSTFFCAISKIEKKPYKRQYTFLYFIPFGMIYSQIIFGEGHADPHKNLLRKK
jgi:hypothetical protein